MYLAAAQLGLTFVDPTGGVAAVWPAAGVALAAFLLSPSRDLPWLAGVVLLVNVIANLGHGNPWAVSVGFGLANLLETVACTWLLGRVVGRPIALTRLREAVGLFAIAVVGVNAFTSAMGAFVASQGLHARFSVAWSGWALANGVGMLLVVPPALSWRNGVGTLRSLRGWRVVEFGGLVVGALVSAFVVFGYRVPDVTFQGVTPLGLPYVVLPPLVWLGLRAGPCLSTATASLVAIVAVNRTVGGLGFFAAVAGARHPIEGLQVFVALTILSALIPSVVIAEREAAEEARRKTDELLKNLLDNAPAAISITGPDERLQVVNRGWETVTGRSRDEVIGLRFDEAVPGHATPETDSSRRVFETGEVRQCEEMVQARDGDTRFLQTVRFPLRDASGGVRAVGAVSLDVTPRKTVEQQLVRLNRLYAVLTEANEAIVRIRDRQTLLDEVCRLVVQVGGFALAWVGRVHENRRVVPESSAGHSAYLEGFSVPLDGGLENWGPVMKAVTEDRVAVWNDLLAREDEGGWRRRARDAGFQSVAATPIRVDGHPPMVLVLYGTEPGIFESAELQMLEELAVDIAWALEGLSRESARQAAEEESARAQRRFRVVFERANDAIFILSDGRFADVNPAAERLLGVTRDALIDRRPTDFSPVRQADGRLSADLIEERLAAALERGPQYFEWLHQGSDGRLLQTEVGLSAIELDGRAMLTAVVRNITDRRALEDQLRQAQKMEAVGRLAGGVAHDFNNLLTVIKGYAELALMDLPPGSPRFDALEQVRKAADRASALTRQLLAFSRKQILEPTLLDVNAVVAETDKMLRRLIGEDVELLTLLTQGLWPVNADRGQLEQVLLNLAINARDAMPGGGRLTIETTNREVDADYVRTHPDAHEGPHVVLSVVDNGIGMTSEIQAHVFEPFFTTKERGRGTGLGLSTVYGIVRQSGGHVTFASEPGAGTRFDVFLPAISRQSARPRVARPSPEAQRGTETVLLVEDDTAVRTLTWALLTRWGYSVLQASGGEEALELSRQRSATIHLLLTDVVMPRLGGKDLADLLQAERPGLRVLFMSGYTEDALGSQGVLAPGVHLLQKPFSPDALARKLREVLDEPA